MSKKRISAGAVHSVPADLRKALISDATARAKWEDITPLARNDWICWVISVKKLETRRQGNFFNSGFASTNPETRSAYARNLRKECAGLVAGQAVVTAETVPPSLVNFGARFFLRSA